MKIFYKLICDSDNCIVKPLTTVEWYIIFTVSAIILAQLPNLNSIAGVSLISAVTVVSYCTLRRVVSVIYEKPRNVSYDPVMTPAKSEMGSICSILNAIGIIAFAFRGHNLFEKIIFSSGGDRGGVELGRVFPFLFFFFFNALAKNGIWTVSDIFGRKLGEKWPEGPSRGIHKLLEDLVRKF